MERTFWAMGTEWWVRGEGATAAQLDEAEALVADLEYRLSRFLPDSALSRLNRERTADDEHLASVLGEAERLRAQTAGAFDARQGAAVIAVGYDRAFDQRVSAGPTYMDTRRPEVSLPGHRISLHGRGVVDLGGIAKGWAVERVADLLGATGPCLIDGGGDLAARGRPSDGAEWVAGVGDGLAVGLRDMAVATSSTLRRRWATTEGEAHHIIDSQTAVPARGVPTAVVVAPRASLADGLATALVAAGGRALGALAVLDAEALLRAEDGSWRMTPGMERHLR